MNLSRVVAYNTLIQVLGKAVTLVFGITTTALLTNYLGAAGFGEYTFALSFVAIFSSIADWGTTLITVREASRTPDAQGQIFGNVLFLRLGLSVLAMLFVWLLMAIFPITSSDPEALRRLVMLSSTLILVFALKTSLEIVFQTKIKMGRTALVEFMASLLTLALSFLIIKMGGSLSLLVSGLILANILATILAFFLVQRLSPLNLSLSLPILKRITLEALPMGGTLILYSVYNRVDAVILQTLKGSEAVGIYGLSYRIYEVLILGAFYLMNSLLPIISQETDRERLRLIYQKTLDILILAGGVVFLGTIILAPIAIKIVALKRLTEFSQSIPLLQILGLAAFVSYLNHLTGYTIVALGKQRTYFLISLGALTFNLILNFLFIPDFSFYAAAWITVLTESLVFLLTSLLLIKTTKFVPNFFSFPQTAFEFLTKRGKIF